MPGDSLPAAGGRPVIWPAHALMQRIATAAVLVALLLPAFLLLPKGFGLALMAVFVLGAAWEWSAFLRQSGPVTRPAYVIAVAVVIAVAELAVPGLVPVSVVATAGLLWWTLAFVWILRFPLPIGRIAAAGCGILVLLPAWLSLAALLYTQVDGRKLLLLALVIVWAADAGAYFAGRRFGRVRLAPRVSPQKTWEGVIGGVLCAALTAAAGAAFLGHPIGPALPLGMSVAGLSVVGDLTVSMFKRNAGLKDSSNLFPGHGGVLDRIDSVTAAAPLFILEAGWLGWLGA